MCSGRKPHVTSQQGRHMSMRSIYGEVNFPFSFCFLSSSIASAVGFRGRFCTDASTGASTGAVQMLRQLLHRCFDRCCAGASAGAAQVLWQLLRSASAGAAQVLRQLLHRCFGRCCDRAVSGVWRVGIGVVWNAGIRGMDGVAGNKLSINEISILVVRYWAPRECLC